MKKVLATILALVMAIGLCSVSWANAAEKEASIGTVKYDTLAAAIAGAQNGETVKLLKDITVTASVQITANKDVTLDLGTKTLTYSGDKTAILCAGTLLLTNGKIVSTRGCGIGTSDNSTNAKITIEKSVTIEAQEMAVLTGKATGATITIEGGNFTAKDNAVIGGNGSERNGSANTIIINDGIFNGGIVTDGYVACGIYAPWKDNITVNGGTFNITKGAGIVARAGIVTVNGGTFNCSGNVTGKVGDSRVVVPCSALVFDAEANYPGLAGDAKITATGGTFTAENGENSGCVATVGANTASRVAVTGGTFSSDVSAYAPEGTPVATVVDGNVTSYCAVGSAVIAAAANNGKSVLVTKAGPVTGVDAGKSIAVADGVTGVTVNGVTVTGDSYTVPQPPRYYYNSTTTTTDTKTTDTKGSPKTFDAGIALYVGMALTSAAGVAFVGKKRED